MATRFCTNCGAALIERASHTGDAVRQYCPTCNTTIYENPSVVVATVPLLGDRVVLIRRATEPGRGRWAYPGGYLEVGETLEEGAIRETREETGLDVAITGLAGVYSRPGGRAITVAFEARAANDAWAPGPEALEVSAFSADTIPWDELAFWTVTFLLEDWVYGRSHGLTPPRAWRIGPARLGPPPASR